MTALWSGGGVLFVARELTGAGDGSSGRPEAPEGRYAEEPMFNASPMTHTTLPPRTAQLARFIRWLPREFYTEACVRATADRRLSV